MTSAVIFVDELPKIGGRSRRRSSKYDPVANKLREQPGRWAVIPTNRGGIQNHLSKLYPDCEFRYREGVLYGRRKPRQLGDEDLQGDGVHNREDEFATA